MSFRKGFPVLLVLVLLATSAPAGPMPGDEPPQNYFPSFARQPLGDDAISEVQTGQPIIWLVIDALRPDHLGCYGYGRETSPALDRLADEGVAFTRFFANAPWTRPATTSMLTGRIPSRHAVQCDWHKLPREVGTLAETLKKAGYTTLAVVGNGNASSAFGLHRGFDDYEDTTKHWKGLPKAGEVFDLGLKLLEKHKGQEKIFLFLFVVDPHNPYRPPPPYDEMFLPGYKGKVVNSPRWEYNNRYTEPVRQKMIALYDGLIRYTDDQIGLFFAKLQKLGFYDLASIFVTADHGEGFGEHGVYLHGHHLYETHLRIPLLVRAPWLKERGKYSAAFLQQIDLFPTFCQLAGIDPPADLQGLSIVDALRDPTTVPVPRYVMSEYNCYGIHRTSIRTRVHKLIYQPPAERELYMKHVKDPKLFPSVSFETEKFHLHEVLKDPREDRDRWPELQGTVGKKLFSVLRDELDVKRPPRKVQELDPQLIEELRSMGYVQ